MAALRIAVKTSCRPLIFTMSVESVQICCPNAVRYSGADCTNTTHTGSSVPCGATPIWMPQGTLDPVCVVYVQSAPEYLTAFGQHIWTDSTLMVKISGRQDVFTAIRSAAMRAYAVLHRHTGASFGSSLVSCVLPSAVPLPEPAL